LEITEAGKIRKLLFTGDLGRKNRSILRDPEPVKAADILICESTYGARFHPEAADNRQKLAKVVKDTASKGGKLIIPSFSLERTQEVVFDPSILKKKNQIPKIDVVIDSPLSTKVTELFKKHVECFDQEAQREFLDHGHNPFDDVIFTRSVEESKALNHRRGPFIIISASGMCEAGRIRHHLRNNITHSKNTILIVGFQAEHTLGRRLVERRPYVKIFDEMHQVNADIEVINGFSGHADQRDLLNFIDQIKGLNKVFLIHGESTQSATLGKKIRQQHPEVLVDIPEEGEVIEA
jgi:metallo-beta-lactamase family protein